MGPAVILIRLAHIVLRLLPLPSCHSHRHSQVQLIDQLHDPLADILT